MRSFATVLRDAAARLRDAAARLRRAGSEPLTRWATVVLVVTIVGSIGLPIVGIGSLSATDILQAEPPWAATAPTGFKPDNTTVSDTVDAVLPGRAVYADRVRDGDFPLWAPLAAGGAPFGSLPNASTLSPLTWPFLVLPLWLAPAVVKVLEMAIAAGFLFLLARRLSLSRPAALVGALVYVNSGFQVVWTNWPQSHVGALIPALFWAVERAWQRGRLVDTWPVPVIGAVMWLEGFPAVTLWAYLAAGVYALLRVGFSADVDLRERVRRLAGLGAAVTAGVAVAAIQLVPFVLWLANVDTSYRAEKNPGALPWDALATFFVPDAFGNPADHVYFADRNYVELQSFVGVVAVVLVIVAAVRWRRSRLAWEQRAFLWGALAVSIAVTYVGGLLLWLYEQLPVIGSNAIGRLRSLIGFLVAVLAAAGFEALRDGPFERSERRRLALAGAGVAVAAAVLLARAGGAAADAGRIGYFLRQLIVPALVTVGTVGALWLAERADAPVTLVPTSGADAPSPRRHLALAGIVALLAVESIAFAHPFWSRTPRDLVYPTTSAHRFLAERLGHDRLAAGDLALYPGTTQVYGLRSVTAHSLTPEPYAQLLLAVDLDALDKNRTFPFLSSEPHVVTSPVLDRMAARFFVAPPDAPVVGDAEEVTIATEPQRVPAGASLNVDVAAGPMRAVRLDLREPIGPEVDTWVDVLVHDGTTVVARGRRRVHPETVATDRFDVPVVPVGGDWPASAAAEVWRVEITVTAESGDLVFGVAEPGVGALSVVRPADDGLGLAFADGVTIYERTRALPRIRWASDAEVEPDAARRVGLLRAGAVAPDTALLSEQPPSGSTAQGLLATEPSAGSGDAGTNHAAPPAGAGLAGLSVLEDSGDAVRVRVDAEAAGILVVADTIQRDWSATMDGQPTDLLEVDHAFAGVAVPAGTYEIVLRYTPSGWGAGQAISLVALLLVAAAAWRSRRPLM